MKTKRVEVSFSISWFCVSTIVDSIVLVQIDAQVEEVNHSTKLHLVDWEFDSILHGFSVELSHKVVKGPFCTPPHPNTIIDKTFPGTNGLD